MTEGRGAMTMKFDTIKYICVGVNLICTLTAGSLYLMRDQMSGNAITSRSSGLKTISQHVQSETCWSDPATEPFKIGDLVVVRGSGDGKIPTGCVIASKTKQYLQVAYSGGELRVTQIYSPKEVNNQISLIKEGAQND